MRERNNLASRIDGVRKLQSDVADTLELVDMAEAEGDAAMVADGMASLRALAAEAKRREIESLLSGEADINDAFKPGQVPGQSAPVDTDLLAGGTAAAMRSSAPGVDTSLGGLY